MIPGQGGGDAGVLRMAGGKWGLFEPFVFRSTGFPIETLTALSLAETITALDTLDAAERDLAQWRDGFLEQGFSDLLAPEQARDIRDKAAIARLYAVRSAVIRRIPVAAADLAALARHPAGTGETWADRLAGWNRIVAGRAELEARATVTFEAEVAERRRRLWQLPREPDFMEAIFLSSPSAAEGVGKLAASHAPDCPGNSKARAIERVIYTYLQRLCAKNETASFFGPVDYGRFVADCPAGMATGSERTGRPATRRVFWAHWVVLALGEKLAESDAVLAGLTPRRNPLLRIVDAAGGAFFLHGAGRALHLTGAARALLLAADGTRTVAELTRDLGLAWADGAALVRRLAAARLLEAALPIPATEVDAGAALVRAVDGLASPPGREAAAPWLREAEALRSGFQAAPWPDRQAWFSQAEAWVADRLGHEARRKGGTLYADRLVLYEDCAGSLEGLTAGGPVLERIAGQLPGLMDFLAGVAVLRWYDAQDTVRARIGTAGSAPPRLIDLLMQPDPGGAATTRFDAFARRLRGLLEDRREPDRITLSAADLERVLDPWRSEIEAGLRRFPLLLPSPDMMIAAGSEAALREGDFELILAELHDDCSTIFGGFFACFHPDPGHLRSLLEQAIRRRPGWQSLGTVLGRRRSKHVTPELPGTTVVLSGVSARGARESGAPESEATESQVPIAELEIVAAKDGHLVLRARGGDVVLYPGDLSSVVHEAFALPRVVPLDWLAILGGEAIPRVQAGGIVVQRAAWDLDAAALRSPVKGELGLPAFHALRQRLRASGIPDWFFVRWASGEKPVLIDTRNPWALDLLRRIAQQADRLRIVEMYPDPDTIFWSSRRGRHSFELRTGLLRDADDQPGFAA